MTEAAGRSLRHAATAASAVPILAKLPGRRPSRGLAVHRNETTAAIINLIATRFPVVRELSGDASFFVRARQFAGTPSTRHGAPSRRPQAFPQFLRGLGTAACFAYLADIAELELAHHFASSATDVRAVPDVVAGLQSAAPELRVKLHPSVSLLRSRFPIVSIWQALKAGEQPSMRNCGPESALVARPALDVEIWRLQPGGFAFLIALSAGMPMARAAAQAIAAAPDFDLPANLATLIGSRVIVGLCRPGIGEGPS